MYSLKHIWVNVKYLSKILFKKPVFVTRLLRNYILIFTKYRGQAKKPIRFIDIALTYKCNMKCEHCSALDMQIDERKPLTLEEYKIISKKLLKAGALVFNFTGGEPLLRPDLLEIIKLFKPKKSVIAIQTNASLLTREKMIEFKKIGVDSIGISIDSAKADEHDKFRSFKGAFKNAIEVLKIGKELGFNMGISYCVTKSNLRSEDREGIENISKKYDTMLNYNLAVPIGFWRDNEDELFVDGDREYLNTLMEKYPKSKTDFETNYFDKGCGAIKEKLYITSYGEVIPCPFIQVSYGNLLTEEFEEIRDRAIVSKDFDHYHQSCLAAEDREFIKKTKCYHKEYENSQMPMYYKEAFYEDEV